jgi:PAS domain S-box-containing protein
MAIADESKFRTLLESAPDAMMTVASDGRILLVNSQTETLFGYGREELLGQPIEILLPGRLRHLHVLHRRDFHAEPRRRPMGLGLDLVARRKDGTEFPTEISLSPLYSDDEGMTVIVVVRDITERKKIDEERTALAREQAARAEAEASSRAKDEFIAIVSHELRTPLTAILGWAVLLRSKTHDEDLTRRALETIERNARSQRQLIDDLLDMSRMVAGKTRLDVQQVGLPAIIEAAIESVRPAASAKAISLDMVSDPDTPAVSGDPGRLQQVVWNLVANAVKFTPTGGRVQILLEPRGSEAEIVVSDTGQGIEPALLPHVFERFRQGEHGTTRAHGGLGLGLAIVRHLVELHGGTVSVSSAGTGMGATFTVTLPIRVSAKVQPPASPGAPAPARPLVSTALWRLDGVHILVVDDDPESRTVLAAILTDYGARVTLAESAADALARLAATTFDVLISDVEMPGEDGYSLIGKMRSMAVDLPAIALTAYARPEDRMRALAAGFETHVAKPVEPNELVAVVARFVQLARLHSRTDA